MASSSYSWERPERDWLFRPPAPADAEATASEDEAEPTPEEAGELLLMFLLELFYTHLLSARSLCVICYWAAKAGALGPVANFSLKPDSASGHFQRKVDSVTGINLRTASERMYKVPVPQHNKYDLSRTSHKMVVQLPHECFVEEVTENLHAATGPLDPEWTEQYRQHPVVLRNPGATVMPYAFYLDGISFTNTDSLLGMFVYSLYSLKRHLCCVIRRSNFCKCGCKGWCTLFPIFSVLKWSFDSLAQGTWPAKSHSGDWAVAGSSEAADDVSGRGDKGGRPLGFFGALLHVKGDWSEFAHTLGMADWNSELFCCLFCKATRANRYDLAGFSPLNSVWGELTHDDLDRACRGCEKWRTLSQPDHARVRAHLHYDKRAHGASGRALFADLPDLQLMKDDRLEPHPGLWDVGLFDKISKFPCRILFWRKSLETRCRHRNPIWDPTIGVTLESLMVDKLHTLHLGPAMAWCCHALWQLILVDAWETGHVGASLHNLSVHYIRSALWNWYKVRKRQMPEKDITEVQNFTLNMLGGKPSSQSLHTKAAETKGLVPFVLDLLKKKRARFTGDLAEILIGAGEAMQQYFDLLDESPRNVPAATLQAMYDAMKRHIILARRAGTPLKPKHHLVLHLVARTAKHGNPGYYATFTDEGINKLLKFVGQAAHRSVWEVRVFLHFGKVEEIRHGKRRHLSLDH